MSAARRMSTAARADEEWLDSIMRGAADLGGEKRFKEDSFLTEMYNFRTKARHTPILALQEGVMVSRSF